jgi:mRNA interferase MazF
MKRSEIWMTDFGPPSGPEQAGVRPAVIVQDDAVSQGLATVIVVPLTTKTKRLTIETTLFIPAGEGGLPQDSVVLCHQVQVRGKVRLLSYVGVLSHARMQEVEDGVLKALGL